MSCVWAISADYWYFTDRCSEPAPNLLRTPLGKAAKLRHPKSLAPLETLGFPPIPHLPQQELGSHANELKDFHAISVLQGLGQILRKRKQEFFFLIFQDCSIDTQ